jgi:hypothetical protein
VTCVFDDACTCLGFILTRRGASEAFDSDGHSLGLYPDQSAAAAAIHTHTAAAAAQEH